MVCGDRDLGSALPLEGIEPDVPHIREGIQVTYRSSVTHAWWLEKLRGTPDNPAPEDLNSLFSVPFALHPEGGPNFGIRVVLAPRGMLGAGALAIKPVKKKVFKTAARLLGLSGRPPHARQRWNVQKSSPTCPDPTCTPR